MTERKQVIILTNSEDNLHTNAVAKHLLRREVNVIRVNTDLVASGKISSIFRLASDRESPQIFFGQQPISQDRILSIWYRRPNLFPFNFSDLAKKVYAHGELENLLEGVWHSLENVQWINNPTSLVAARRKVFQLHVARKVGFSIPNTLITSDVAEAKQFVAETHNVVLKTIHRGFFDDGEAGYSLPTTMLTPQMLSRLDLIQNLPAMFQEAIDKVCDVRVTCVGEKSFAASIKIPEGLGLVDWRPTKATLPLSRIEAIALDKSIEARCHSMLRKLGLMFGAFDFAVDRKGCYFFLELNPNGQWFWIEELTGLPISMALADALADQDTQCAI